MRILLLLLLVPTMLFAKSRVEPAIATDPVVERKIRAHLKEMTLEQKVGQMCQITIGALHDKRSKSLNFSFNDKLDSAITHYQIGSILNTPFGVAQTPAMWEEIIGEIQRRAESAGIIPILYGLDQIHGATYTMGATFFPQGINMAASFDRELMHEAATIAAYETRASNVAWSFSPTMDLGRDPRWSRMWESFGEDVLVNAQMGLAMVEGFQGDDPNHLGRESIAACIKHYLGYGVPVSGKDRTPSSINPTDMRERYFAPFKESIQGGALSLMVNSGINNGLPFHANYELITEWLKRDLNWDGMVVSDWADIKNLYTRDRIAESPKDAARLAINAGIDMVMEPYDFAFCTDLIELVKEGEVSIKRIDDAVSRILRLKYRIGLFDRASWSASEYPKFASEEFAAVALKAAQNSQVLLKNIDNLLPLKEGTKILVTGPNANSMRSLNGGWSYTWQGIGADTYTGDYDTIYEALAGRFGADNVSYVPTVEYDLGAKKTWQDETVEGLEDIANKAEEYDVIVACIGENSYCETVGNMNDLNLSANQKMMVRRLSESGKPIVLIINSGRPRIIGDIEPLSSAVVNAMLPSNYGGRALANLLAGDCDFTAKMPYTYPREINSLSTYDFKPSESRKKMAGAYNYEAKIDTQWDFGFGLSYAKYSYSQMSVTPQQFDMGDELEIKVKVTNRSDRDGSEAVLLYSSDHYASITPDNRRLRSFTKVALGAGESRVVTMVIPASDLAFVGYDGRWRLESGAFTLLCGDQKFEINCVEDYIWNSPNIKK
ncbi:MAG: glycoside hydrolase family 3 N-terminal domain-containing protein [Rikenellaceae bacterium]